ncbi:MAG: transposase [Planctomycetes bacterium]|nr:transposase [Planctomycetota bacterium]
MLSLPSAAEPLFLKLSVAFTRPTFQRILPLCIGAILAIGPRTITALLRIMRGLVGGHPSSYHRVFSRAAWPLEPLGKVVAAAVLRWGHRWVVLAISVKFPFTSRRWALPVLAALYRPKELNKAEGRRHKTAPDLARQLMATLIHWFSDRTFVFLGDGGYASHELARFCFRHRGRATLVIRFHGDANLYAPPPQRKGRKGRPRIKGAKLPAPQSVVQRSQRTPVVVDWYGGGQRRIEWVGGTGQWYKGGQGLIPIRWVFVHDLQGTHRDEYFYTTDTTLMAEQIITYFTARWPIETTFQEVRAHLGFETPRQRVAKSVLRTGPCLLGLFSMIILIFAVHARRHRIRLRATAWYTKTEPTFSDAITTVRRLFGSMTIFERSSHSDAFQKIPCHLRNLLLNHLSRAA